MIQDLYISGKYLEKNPTWHVDESPWKAKYVLQLMAKNHLTPQTICEVGCGAGKILKLMQESMDKDCLFWGYEISPQAFELCQSQANEKLQFKLADIRQENDIHFDLLLIMDVLEHLEDYFSFLRELQPKSDYKIIQLPLDISVRSVFRGYLSTYRNTYGHLHYFTKDVAIQMLKDTGLEIIDYMYTSDTPSFHTIMDEIRRNPRKLPRKLIGFVVRKMLTMPDRFFFALDQDVAARVLGKWRLLVLAK
ncbi:MAG: hypothetical protein NVS4B12_19650 [Ktedonobacteraceae bacterium]